ncbi:uncharacterized protein PHACADRAFT_250736 [Phanerochaete carnosa HHB-10118-sp]|uniref:Uncharacterized protein n=1 Tax=Phanerochaete carnosa (strain HHB-10118-sp) TaxID=650164 RepID=K5WL85_PHACS|nr:uncharacterized protein PHACADRAFT_250736 [Phanerochaete carnosa HHB-10118-sp]EKM59929.1 hypothetical protein PHACADRAFT_250736 [Phanerochaete carnosa HHB-10118-sp]
MEVLGPAEDVRFLLVCGATAMDLSAALRPQVGMRQPLFPKLKQLKLVQVAFDGVFVPHDRNGYRWGNEWFTEFMGALEARSALDPGLQLEKLYIQDAKNVTVGMVEELEKYVLEVVLDSLPDDESQNHTCMESHVGNSR